MNHSNRSGNRKAPGRNPTPAEIRALFEHMKAQAAEASGRVFTQEDFADWLYASRKTVEAWFAGTRRMGGLTWEVARMLVFFPEVRRARARLLTDEQQKNLAQDLRS